LVLLLSYAQKGGQANARKLLLKLFETISALNPSKNAVDYWLAINNTFLSFSKSIENLWNIEKSVATESIAIAKEEALTLLAKERIKSSK
jgi:type II restriction enzyme